MQNIELTPTEERMYRVLMDGCCHGEKQLISCLDDELSSKAALWMALSRLRKKVAVQHKHIMRRVIDGVTHYQLVRIISIGE